ncbi:MAG: hypothetical protein FJ308_16030, partial [Planctomycetes bacterium]|nr:hypothetical protein [Planctomycetota bacterium]
MKLLDDIKSEKVLHLKGFLFLALGIVAASLLLYDNLSIRTIALLMITIWAFCRFYYILFYVLEKYAGRDR